MPKYSELSAKDKARYDDVMARRAAMEAPIPDDAMGENVPSHPIKQRPSMFMEAAKNAPGSLYHEYVEPLELQNLMKMPEAIGGLLRGSYHKLAGTENEPSTKYVDALVGETARPYESAEALENEFRKNPARLFDDAMLATGIAGGAAKALGGLGRVLNLARSGETLKSAGNVVQAASEVGSPTAMVQKGVDAIQTKRLKMRDLMDEYQSAAKFKNKLSLKEKDAITTTALREGIALDRAGVDQLKKRIEDTGSKLDAVIESSVARGDTIPLDFLGKELAPLKKHFGKFSRSSEANLAKLKAAKKEFFEYYAKQGKTKLTMRDLQDFKHAEYSKIKFDNKNMNMGSAGWAENEIAKAFARSAKKQMDKMAPEIKPINTEWGELKELQTYHTPAASRIRNNMKESILDKQDINTAGLMGGGAGAAAAHALGIDPMLSAAGISGVGMLMAKRNAGKRNATRSAIDQVQGYNRMTEGPMSPLLRNHPITFATGQGVRRLNPEDEEKIRTP